MPSAARSFTETARIHEFRLTEYFAAGRFRQALEPVIVDTNQVWLDRSPMPE
jgi:hypothetical protein